MELVIIAEAGGTSTDWMIYDTNSGIRETFSSCGINASVSPISTITESIGTLRNIIDSTYQEAQELDIHFYGAGCNSELSNSRITEAFKALFENYRLEIEIENDIKGASIALFGDSEGIACILGTGSATAVYDGKSILQSIPSLGYVLGDEGSGAYFGRELINKYFKLGFSSQLSELIRQECQFQIPEVIKNVYQSPDPNRYLASFMPFIIKYRELREIKKMIYDGINEFFKRNINRYIDSKRYPLGFVGSLAYYFSDILYHVAENEGYRIEKIVRQPLEEIADYVINRQI